MAAIELVDIRKTYPGGAQVVHGINLSIADGELVVLVGPSGCGKSTLLRMVAGLETVTEGTISIGGNNVNAVEPAERDIAMVFQNYALYPHMSVRGNLEYGLKNRNTPRELIDQRVTEAARMLEITPFLDRKPRQLVGRPAPARRHGPRPGAPAQGLPVRRAFVQSRCQAARTDAH